MKLMNTARKYYGSSRKRVRVYASAVSLFALQAYVTTANAACADFGGDATTAACKLADSIDFKDIIGAVLAVAAGLILLSLAVLAASKAVAAAKGRIR